MNTLTTNRPVNLGQLSTELGGAPLSMTGDVIECYDEAITAAQLQEAVNAHDAQPEPEPGPPEPEGPSPLALLQAQVDELTDITMELLMGT